MKQLTIIRKDPKTQKKSIVRVVNVSSSFIGIDPQTGSTIYSEFVQLAKDLEPRLGISLMIRVAEL